MRRPRLVRILFAMMLAWVGSGLCASAQVTETHRGNLCYLIAHSVGGLESFLPPAEPSFADVPLDYCAYAEVEYAVSLAVIAGYYDGLFHPEYIITRDRAAVYTARVIDLTDGDLGSYIPPVTPTFPDVPSDHWAYKDVEYIVAKGIPTGYPSGFFGPGDLMDMYEAADWLAAATGTYVDPSTTPCLPDPPAADFSGEPQTGVAPLTVDFVDLSTGAVTGWSWDFGDGTTSTLQHPSHEYTIPGIFTVALTVSNLGGSDTDIKEVHIEVIFPDVAADYWACDYVLVCVGEGIVQGYPEGDYKPEVTVTRDQMAVYIARALAGGEGDVPEHAGDPTFPDVPEDHWAFDYVEYAVSQGVVQGYPEGDYRPEVQVTRAQMAVYVARSVVTPTGEAGLVDYTPPDEPTFPDVPNTGYGEGGTDPYWAFKHIEYCAENDIVQGYPEGDYKPEVVVTRDQMSVYVARAFELVNPFGGVYSGNYSSGVLTIVVGASGRATLAVIDDSWGILVGTGSVSPTGALTATATREGISVSVGVSGQFVSQAETVVVAGPITGVISAEWTGERVTDVGANAFAGNWSGTYWGTESGTWEGVAQADGSVTWTAHSPSVGTFTLTGAVAPVGPVLLEGSGSGAGGPFTITWEGIFYMRDEQFLGSGTWDSTSGYSGQWSGQRE